MPWVSIVYERSKLYEEVWAEPMRDVASRYDVSDVALGKTCRKLGVPTPGRGYWARKAAGTAVEPPPLPRLRRGQAAFIRVERWHHPAVVPQLSPLAQLRRIERELILPIVVAAELEAPHPVVAALLSWLQEPPSTRSHSPVCVSG